MRISRPGVLVLIAGFALSACHGGSAPNATTDEKLAPRWTVLLYMAADNNLEFAAVEELESMLRAKTTEPLDVLVEIDRSAERHEGSVGSVANWTGVKRFRIREGKLTELADLGEHDQSNPEHLSDFIAWGLLQSPAPRVALVLWNHGSGWSGFGDDDTAATSGAHMNLPVLSRAIRKGLEGAGRQKFDLIGFDACLMAGVEVVYELRNETDYVLASEELELADAGWDWESLLEFLSAHPDAGPVAFGQQVLDNYSARVRLRLAGDAAAFDETFTLSLSSTAGAEALTTALHELGDALSTHILSRAYWQVIAYTQLSVSRFGFPGQIYGSADIGELVEHVLQFEANETADHATRRDLAHVQALARNVMTELHEVVVAKENGVRRSNAAGLSIYIPQNKAELRRDLGDYVETAFGAHSGWRNLFAAYHLVLALDDTPPEITIDSISVLSESVQFQFHLKHENDVQAASVVVASKEGDQFFVASATPLLADNAVQLDEVPLRPWILSDGTHSSRVAIIAQVGTILDAAPEVASIPVQVQLGKHEEKGELRVRRDPTDGLVIEGLLVGAEREVVPLKAAKIRAWRPTLTRTGLSWPEESTAPWMEAAEVKLRLRAANEPATEQALFWFRAQDFSGNVGQALLLADRMESSARIITIEDLPEAISVPATNGCQAPGTC